MSERLKLSRVQDCFEGNRLASKRVRLEKIKSKVNENDWLKLMGGVLWEKIYLNGVI